MTVSQYSEFKSTAKAQRRKEVKKLAAHDASLLITFHDHSLAQPQGVVLRILKVVTVNNTF